MEVIGEKLSKLSILAEKNGKILPACKLWFPQRGPKEQLPYQELGRFIAMFGIYRSNTLKTVNFGQKMALNRPNFAISEFS